MFAMVALMKLRMIQLVVFVSLCQIYSISGFSVQRVSQPYWIGNVVPRFLATSDGHIEGMPPTTDEHSDEIAGAVRKHRSSRGRVDVSKRTTNNRGAKRRTRLVLLNDPKFKKGSSNVSKTKTTSRRKLKSSQKSSNVLTLSKPRLKPSNGIDLRYESTIACLRVYRSKSSDLVLPRKWIVPENEDFPAEWHGIDLAATVYDMKWWQKHIKQKPDRVAELNELGFVWERLQPEWNLVLEALITYSLKNGNLLVPSKFIVPHGDTSWPKATWGIPLGNAVYRIRSRGDFLRGNSAFSRRDQLDALDFVWDIQEHRFQIFHSALKKFAEMEGQDDKARPNNVLRVPSTFVIPATSEWPEELWGYKLGEKCTAIRQKGLYVKGNLQRQQMLVELGFQIHGNASLGWLEVVHAAAVYSQMNDRKLDVPARWKVPAPPHRVSDCDEASDSCIVGSDEAWPWPEYLWGFPLGQRLKDIRLKGAYLSGETAKVRRRQLDALGFNWTPKRGRKPVKR